MDFHLAIDKIRAMGQGFMEQLPNLVLGILFFVVAYYLGKYVSNFVGRVSHRGKPTTNLSLVLSRLTMTTFVMLAILIFSAIVFPSVKPADILSLLGVGGVAIGFAFKDIFQNMLAGILILFTEPFEIGDSLTVDKFEGTIEDIQVRATIMRMSDNRKVIIPNSDIFMSKIIVNHSSDRRKGSLKLTIPYSEDLAKAQSTILSVLERMEEISQDPKPSVKATQFLQQGVVLDINFWIQLPKTKDLGTATDQAIRDIIIELQKQNIQLVQAASTANTTEAAES